MGPMYFTRICVPVSDNTAWSSLRSAQRGDLFVPRMRTKLGTRSFCVSAPTVWNSLPTELRSTSVSRDTFKSRLKCHFYADAYLHQVWERLRLRQQWHWHWHWHTTVTTSQADIAIPMQCVKVRLQPPMKTDSCHDNLCSPLSNCVSRHSLYMQHHVLRKSMQALLENVDYRDIWQEPV